MRERKPTLFLFLTFTYLSFFGNSTYSARCLVLRIIAQLLPMSLLGTWLFTLLRDRRGFPRSQVEIPLLGWLGVALIASFTGLCPRLSLERVWLHLTYVLGFYALADLQSRGWQPIVFRAMFLTASVVCVVGLFEWLSWYLGLSFLPGMTMGWLETGAETTLIPPVCHRLNATLGGSTPLAGFLAVLIPPAIGWIVTTRSVQTRWGLGLWLAAAVPVEILTFSRGGVLALAVSLSVMGLGWISMQEHWRRSFRERFGGHSAWKSWTWLLIGIIIAALAVVFWLSRSFTGRAGSTAHRFVLWDAALDALSAHPAFGVGPANFGRALLIQNDASLPRRQIQTAHSAYLNTAAEMGLSGVMTFIWLVVAAACRWRANWKEVDTSRRLRMIACAASLVGLAAQLLVDSFTAPANWIPVLVITAFCLAPSNHERSSQGFASWRSWPVAAIVALLVFSAWLGWKDAAQFHFERSVRLKRRGEYEKASQEAYKAQMMDDGLSLYTFQRAHIAALWAGSTHNASLADQAIAHYNEGLSLDPIWGKQTANLAILLRKQGHEAQALQWMERTVTADPRPAYLVNLGVLCENMGAEAEAWENYGRALARNPSWAGSGFWTAEATRAAAWPEILRRAERAVGATSSADALVRFRAQVASARADFDQVEDLARSMVESRPDSPEGYIWLARSLLSQNEAEDALAAAAKAVKTAPTDSRALALRGCSRWQAERDQDSTEDLRTALFISPGNQDAHVCMGLIYEETGELDAAIESYKRALSGQTISQDVEMTLYDRLATFEPLPGFVDIRMGESAAAPWLRAARLYEKTDRCEAARAVYEALLAQDEFLETAFQRLQALPCYVSETG